MPKVNVYTKVGTKSSASQSLPKGFSEKENMTLLAQAIRVYESNTHPGTSKTKTRSEVTGSRRKIWRQKGTGRARHGAVSAPIFVKGGRAHGPTGLKRGLVLPKKMKQKALAIALSMKAKEKKIAVVSQINSVKKTKEAEKMLNAISKKQIKKTPKRVLLVLSGESSEAVKVFRNIPTVLISRYRNLNARDVFYADILIIDREVFSKKKAKEAKKS